MNGIQQHLSSSDPALWSAAAWPFALLRQYGIAPVKLPPKVLDRLVFLWLNHSQIHGSIAFALSSQVGLPRGAWNPTLTPTKVQELTRQLESADEDNVAAARLVAFHSGAVFYN